VSGGFYVAEALDTFRGELNALYPNRDKTSDGAKGDDAHSNRKSEHNPAPPDNVVRARDFDKDGIPVDRIVKFIVERGKAGDPRCGEGAYVIWNGVIWSYSSGWKPKRYTGSNKHDHHFHFSIAKAKAAYDSVKAWGLKAYLAAKPTAKKTAQAAPKPKQVRNPYAKHAAVCERGARGSHVQFVSWAIDRGNVRDTFDAALEASLAAFQKKHPQCGRTDGKAGPATLDVLRRVTHSK
jgi:hypothetical protein